MQLNYMSIKDALGKRQMNTPEQPAPSPLLVNGGDAFVGIEIALEDWKCNVGGWDERIAAYWVEHEEGSLRNGREFVLSPPRKASSIIDALDNFFGLGARWNPSERASVHVHVDMTNGYTVQQFRTLFVLTYMLEGAIYRVADENRKWASYSCPLSDMRQHRMASILAAPTAAEFKKGLVGAYHEEKYYGFNCVSLTKHGTIEFRYFPCTTDKDTIISWINLCYDLYYTARDIVSIDALYKTVRDMGVVRFLKQHMPKSAEALLVYLDEEDACKRLANCVAMVNDAGLLKPIKEVPCEQQIKSVAFTRMLEKVCAPVYEEERKIVEHDAVRVPVDELYAALLKQAKANI